MNMQELMMVMPEIFLLSMSCIILIMDLFLSSRYKIISYAATQVSLIVTAILCWSVASGYLPQESYVSVFSNQFMVDYFSQIMKIIILIIIFFVMVYSRAYINNRKMPMAEYQVLILFSTLGMMCLASANSLLMIYLGLELLSLPLYTLVALNRDSALSVEAGMKYFIMGSLASGLLLYGLSLLFGLTGSLILSDIAIQIWTADGTTLSIYLLSIIFIVIGISFKFGAVPFHMWVPDVYEGAASSVTMLISSAPKVAAFALAYRLLHDTLPELSQVFGVFFIILAILSLALGNIIAIAQTNLKRMLGYSTIGHVGFILLGLATGASDGYNAVAFYIVAYTLLTLGAFATIVLLSPSNFEAENINDLKGLARRSPWIAFLMMIFMFSFAGIPPTVGFYAKFIILKSLVDIQLTWVAALAVLFSVIGAYYYLRVIKVMYFDMPEGELQRMHFVNTPWDARIALSINGLAALGFGILPAPLFFICQKMLS